MGFFLSFQPIAVKAVGFLKSVYESMLLNAVCVLVLALLIDEANASNYEVWYEGHQICMLQQRYA